MIVILRRLAVSISPPESPEVEACSSLTATSPNNLDKLMALVDSMPSAERTLGTILGIW